MVLVVEDEADIGRLLAHHLGHAGLEVEVVNSGAEALATARSKSPAVVVLDLMLPDVPGMEVCRQLRADPVLSEVGILILTARGDEHDRVAGFAEGADDYVVKPFNVHEVTFRVKALMRRLGERRDSRSRSDEGRRLRWRGLEVDPVRHRTSINGEEIELRPIEFKLLSLLLENPGRVFSRDQLLDAVWGSSSDVHERTVDVHVRRLREQLGDHGKAVETVHGFGYRLRDT